MYGNVLFFYLYRYFKLLLIIYITVLATAYIILLIQMIIIPGHTICCTLTMIGKISKCKMKWNESGFRPPLCTYRLSWARRTFWGWWDDWDDTVLQTQDSKFEPWRSEAEHATSRSRRLPTILTFTRGWGRNNFVSFKPPRPETEPRTLAWKAAVLTTTLGPPPKFSLETMHIANTGQSSNVVLMFGHRLRRWANIKPALVQRPVFVGLVKDTSVWLRLNLSVCN